MFYQFADPTLEERSAGQKFLIRMGPANAAAVKDKLRELSKPSRVRSAPNNRAVARGGMSPSRRRRLTHVTASSTAAQAEAEARGEVPPTPANEVIPAQDVAVSSN